LKIYEATNRLGIKDIDVKNKIKLKTKKAGIKLTVEVLSLGGEKDIL
jgi:hypothetical protein